MDSAVVVHHGSNRRTSRRPFLAGTIGRSRRRARRRARARGRSKPARRRPPRPPGLLMIFLRGALPRPRRRRPRRRRARSSSPPRCGRRPDPRGRGTPSRRRPPSPVVNVRSAERRFLDEFLVMLADGFKMRKHGRRGGPKDRLVRLDGDMIVWTAVRPSFPVVRARRDFRWRT